MNWTDLLIKIQMFFFYAASMAVAGSMAVVFLKLLKRSKTWKYSRMKILWIKIALLLFLLPLSTIATMIPRIGVSGNGIVYYSEFGLTLTKPMQGPYIVLALVWIVGLVPGIIFRSIQYLKLKRIMAGNIPVEDADMQEMIVVYQEKFSKYQVEFYQNDLLEFPITVKSFHSQVILPVKRYTKKELHMVLEHEMNHIRRKDLIWKKIGLLAVFLHWWNPLVYILLNELILQLEIECDIETCNNNHQFTMKEYGQYLTGMPEKEEDMVFVSALCKSKKDLFWRLETMARRKKCHKSTMVLCGTILLLTASIPSYAAAEGIAKSHEKWISDTEISVRAEKVDYHVMEKTTTAEEAAEETVEEIDFSNETEAVSNLVTLDHTINSNTRLLYQKKMAQKGDEILISIKCSKSDAVYRIGLKDSDGNLTWREGSGKISHIFEITSTGSYTLYVENRNSFPIEITGNVI